MALQVIFARTLSKTRSSESMIRCVVARHNSNTPPGDHEGLWWSYYGDNVPSPVENMFSNRHNKDPWWHRFKFLKTCPERPRHPSPHHGPRNIGQNYPFHLYTVFRLKCVPLSNSFGHRRPFEMDAMSISFRHPHPLYLDAGFHLICALVCALSGIQFPFHSDTGVRLVPKPVSISFGHWHPIHSDASVHLLLTLMSNIFGGHVPFYFETGVQINCTPVSKTFGRRCLIIIGRQFPKTFQKWKLACNINRTP